MKNLILIFISLFLFSCASSFSKRKYTRWHAGKVEINSKNSAFITPSSILEEQGAGLSAESIDTLFHYSSTQNSTISGDPVISEHQSLLGEDLNDDDNKMSQLNRLILSKNPYMHKDAGTDMQVHFKTQIKHTNFIKETFPVTEKMIRTRGFFSILLGILALAAIITAFFFTSASTFWIFALGIVASTALSFLGVKLSNP